MTLTAKDYEDDLNNYNWLANEVDRHETEQAMALGKLLIEKVWPRSVIDIGCSSGVYLVPFINAGLEVLGIDGAEGVGRWCKPDFEVVDLRNPWTPPHQFSLSLCIEVLEHIPPQFADRVVQTICDCAPIAFVSAAHPGQNGEGHVNEQNFPYWQEKFAARGFVYDEKLTGELMAIINTDPVYQHCGWLTWHSWVFCEAA